MALPLAAYRSDKTQRAKPALEHNSQATRRLKGQERGHGDAHLGEGPVQRQPTAQCHDASQRVGTGEGGVEGQGPTLEGGENEKSVMRAQLTYPPPPPSPPTHL